LIFPGENKILIVEVAVDSLQRRRHKEFLRQRIVFHTKHIGLAADLAVFDIALPAAGGFVHAGDVPLSTARALETGLHEALLLRRPCFYEKLYILAFLL